MKKGLIYFVLFAFITQPLSVSAIIIDDVEYGLNGKEATIRDTRRVDRDTLIIPETITYDGLLYTVTKVKRLAFGALDSYRYIKLPKSIIEMENCAFTCWWDGEDHRPLSTVDLSACTQLRSIPDSCFYGRSFRESLENVYLPNSIMKIGFRAFCHCNIKDISLPTQLKEIEREAFAYTKLKSVLIPQNVINIDKEAFNNCNLLRTIIYLPITAPKNWIATSDTYVPDKVSYSSPTTSINNAQVIEMITFNQVEFEYSGLAPSTTWTNNVEGYTATLDIPTLNADAGKHTVNISTTFNDGDYTFIAQIPYHYTISPIKLKAKVSNVSRRYGEENPSFNIIYSGFLSGDSESIITTKPSVVTTATQQSDVGEYPITISGGYATNYEFVYETGVLTVTRAPLSAKVNDAAKVYGAPNPAFTIDYYGLRNGEDAPSWITRPSFLTDATQTTGVGNYTVKATNGVPVNYDLGEITPGTLNITPAPLTIKAYDATRQYYSDEPNFSYTCSGFVNGDNESVLSPAISLSTSATRTSGLGTYEIKISETSNPNYSISYVNGTLNISPRTLTASVGNYERPYNEDNPAFELEYKGFVDNEDERVLNAKAIASTTATKTSNVGAYPITVSGGSADNYKFSYLSGTLTINKAEQTLSWEQELSNLKVGDQVELKAEASSGLPITYTMEENNAAEIYSAGTKQYIDCKAGGKILIRAVQSGNNNYYSSPRASNTVSIVGSNPSSDPVLTINQGDNGAVKTQVSKGSVYTFTISPSNGWKIHTVTFNNADVTYLLNSDNTFTTPAINDNASLIVVYEKDNNAVNPKRQSAVKIQGMSFGIRVLDAQPEDVIQVYSSDGILQKSAKVEGEITDVPLTEGKVYIVKVGDKTVKLGIIE